MMFELVDNPNCPQCGNQLLRVKQVQPAMLNDGQFDAVKAGDWYCESCRNNGRGFSNFAYFWNKEVGL